ncbi:MAG: alpha/beta hydrolase [Propionibacteriaceae bacterium]|jgi:pimeloyl-ACP methyl ester carboxylesterase|nr:alpha/beta hydrolase [Propionibacteriaceae bacterium]
MSQPLFPPLQFVSAAGRATPYRRMGSGPAVGLVHSLGGSLLNWDRVQPALAERADTLVYDWGGHGGSEKAMEPFSMADLGDQLADLLGQVFGRPALLAGVAAGSAIALQCALDHPERVAGLVLGAPTSAVAEATGQGMRERVGLIRSGGMATAVDASVQAGFPEAFRELHPEVIERYRHEFMSVAPQAYANSSDAFSRFDVSARLSQVGVPVLLLPGELDPYFPPPVAEGLRQRRPDWRLQLLPGVGHFEHLQAPDLIVQAVLSQLPG